MIIVGTAPVITAAASAVAEIIPGLKHIWRDPAFEAGFFDFFQETIAFQAPYKTGFKLKVKA